MHLEHSNQYTSYRSLFNKLINYEVMIVITFLLLMVSPITAQTSEKSSDGLVSKSARQAAIRQLNTYKCMHGQSIEDYYTYDYCIEKFTQKWADTQASVSALDHSMVSYEQFQCSSPNGYGENVGSGQRNITILLADFYSEVSLYNWTNPTYQPKAGHFTAMIWKNSTLFAMGGKKSASSHYPYWSTNFGSPEGPAPNTIGSTYFSDNVTPLVKTWNECAPIVAEYEQVYLKNSATTLMAGSSIMIAGLITMLLMFIM